MYTERKRSDPRSHLTLPSSHWSQTASGCPSALLRRHGSVDPHSSAPERKETRSAPGACHTTNLVSAKIVSFMYFEEAINFFEKKHSMYTCYHDLSNLVPTCAMTLLGIP